MSTAGPWVTTKNSPHTQPHSFPESVLNKRFYSIMRTGGAKPTRAPKKRTQKILVKLNKTYNYSQHLCNLTNNSLYSSFILETSPLVTAQRKRTTTSNPTKSF